MPNGGRGAEPRPSGRWRRQMRSMNRTGWVVLVLACTITIPVKVAAQIEGVATEGEDLRNAQMVKRQLASRAQRLGTSAGPDPDTVYVGKSYTNHIAPDNY